MKTNISNTLGIREAERSGRLRRRISDELLMAHSRRAAGPAEALLRGFDQRRWRTVPACTE